MYHPCRMFFNANLHALALCPFPIPVGPGAGVSMVPRPNPRLPRRCAMPKTVRAALIAMSVLFGAFAAGVGAEEATGPRDATEATRRVNAAVSRDLPFTD